MKSAKTKLIIIAIVTMMSFSHLSAQWNKTNGPYTAYVTSFSAIGTNLFVATLGDGVYKSTNNGTSWNQMNIGLLSTFVTALVASGNNLYAGTQGSGIFLSTNSGQTWIPARTGLGSLYITSLASRQGILFAGTDGILYSSNNSGSTWVPLPGLPGGSIILGVIDSSLYVMSYDGVYRQQQDSTAWVGPLIVGSVNALAKEGGNLYAATNLSGVYVSTNNGQTWNPSNAGIGSGGVKALCVRGGSVFAGSDAGVFVSTDHGKVWKLSNSNYYPTHVGTFIDFGGSLFVGTWGDGVYRSIDNGTSWSPASTDLRRLGVQSLCSSDTTLFAGTIGRGMCVSTNKGTSWEASGMGLAGNQVNSIVIGSANIVFAATDSGVFRSTNSGRNWNSCNTGLTSLNVNALLVYGNLLFAGTSIGVSFSTDNGGSWFQTGFPRLVTSFAAGNNKILAGTQGFGVYQSTDDGATWASANVGLVGTYVNSFAVNRNSLFVATDGAVSVSSNNGGKWSPLFYSSVFVLLANQGNLFAGSIGAVLYSTDNGATWRSQNTGFTVASVRSLHVSGENLFSGTFDDGVWMRSIPDLLTTASLSEHSPVTFTLAQNYPNPFNPSTTIRYGLPLRSHVTLTVYNTLGQQVAVLQNGEQEAGYHEVRFDASGMASGVYFCRITAGTYVETRKLLLIR